MAQQRDKEKKKMRRVSLEDLPDHLLCQTIGRLDLYDKIRLQLVSRKLHALLTKPPPGDGLWGSCNLSVHFGGYKYLKPNVSR